VRSDDSWHAVSRVVKDSHVSRRSLTATFYREGSVSSMWPPGELHSLHSYQPAQPSMWKRIKQKLRL